MMKRILIVDDDKKIRRIYTTLLDLEGYKVQEASSADEANEILKREKIDLTLLDIKMPEAGGDTMYEVMKTFHRKSKVIVASVYPLDEQKSIISGADDYFDKSQGVDILLAKIKKVLANGSKKSHCR